MRFCGAVAIALGMGFMGGLVIEIPDYSGWDDTTQAEAV